MSGMEDELTKEPWWCSRLIILLGFGYSCWVLKYHLLPLTVVHLSIFIPNIWYLFGQGSEDCQHFCGFIADKGSLKKRPQVWECHGMHILGLFQPSMPSRAPGGVSNRKLRNCAWKGWRASGTGTGLEDLEEVYGIYRHLLVKKRHLLVSQGNILLKPRLQLKWQLHIGSEDHLWSSDVLRTYVRATRRQRIAISLQRAGPSNSRRRWYGCWKFLKEPWNLGIRWVAHSCSKALWIDNCYIFRQLYKCSASPLIISFRGSSQGRAKIFTEWLCFSHLGVP